MWRVFRVVAIGLVVVVAGGCASGNRGTGHPISDFNDFADQVKSDLSTCTNMADLVQIELGGYLVNGDSSNFNLVQLDTDSKSAQTACDEAKDGKLASLASLDPPSSISYIQSLSSAAGDTLLWATNDTTAVLHDLQRLAESNGSGVANASQLSTDVAQADHDAGTVRYDFSNAAQRLGIRNFEGVGLITWGSSSSGTSPSTPSHNQSSASLPSSTLGTTPRPSTPSSPAFSNGASVTTEATAPQSTPVPPTAAPIPPAPPPDPEAAGCTGDSPMANPSVLWTSCNFGTGHGNSDGTKGDSEIWDIGWSSWTAQSATGTGTYYTGAGQGPNGTDGPQWGIDIRLSSPRQTTAGYLFIQLSLVCDASVPPPTAAPDTPADCSNMSFTLPIP